MSATFTSRVACALTSLVVLAAAYASSVPASFETFDLSSVVGGVDCTHPTNPFVQTGQCADGPEGNCGTMFRRCRQPVGVKTNICTNDVPDTNGCGTSMHCMEHAEAQTDVNCDMVGT